MIKLKRAATDAFAATKEHADKVEAILMDAFRCGRHAFALGRGDPHLVNADRLAIRESNMTGKAGQHLPKDGMGDKSRIQLGIGSGHIPEELVDGGGLKEDAVVEGEKRDPSFSTRP